jgi:uncharacterized membrane protein YeaQ/YmgE (transglycosylase-associated protein family)
VHTHTHACHVSGCDGPRSDAQKGADQDEHVGVSAFERGQLESGQGFLGVWRVEAHAQRAVAAQQQQDKPDYMYHTVLGWVGAARRGASAAVSAWGASQEGRARILTFVAAVLGEMVQQSHKQLGHGRVAQHKRREFLRDRAPSVFIGADDAIGYPCVSLCTAGA